MKDFKRVFCLFEQSGTFRDVFRELGYLAKDIDIADSFGKTDIVTDIFKEISSYFAGRFDESIFSDFDEHDLVLAFFPCTYFETQQSLYYTLNHANIINLPLYDRCLIVRNRLQLRLMYHTKLLELVALADKIGFQLIIENPYHLNYLTWGNNFPKPTLVDLNRRRRGDYFVKPTAYWFFNCYPTYGQSYVMPSELKSIVKMDNDSGEGEARRSLISPVYAKNFVNDFILGRSGDVQQTSLAL